MPIPNTVLNIATPVIMLLGLYCLVRCIARARRIIFPDVRIRFAASASPCTLTLPQPGRYVINLVIPPLTFITGVAYFAARFSVATSPGGEPLAYRAYGRSLFSVQRTDMSGNQSTPLGAFDCVAPGDVVITCLNPETIRAQYQLEVAPHVPPLTVVCLVLAIIASFAMTFGGLIVFLLSLAGRV
ncbi:hypothetical protein [Pseudomonas alabamensis]|uniref:hypothetical protein n=1 Tax=Pseudomonas alabamensis TaxID=3064349 RepID=UPI0021DA0800|nr:hypothetical protein [Pseudomonas entomophila]